ncbi:hypothetical protein FRB97_000303 [Tulasnella sp. 331]|nr:hypothetical protein FRB97_000303 [Tulasnella sp. 331]
MVRPRVFFDFSIGDAPVSRVVFELFRDVVPKTCENFRALCTGELGVSKLSDVPLSYKGSTIHRSIANFMVQGGDFTRHNGKGGESIYGAPFEDEDLTQEIGSEGLLVMANKGPATNGSQWFVTLRPCPHLNGKHVVFGRVVFGYETILRISQVPVDEKDRPLKPITVTHCGELELRKVAAKPANIPDLQAPVRSRSRSSAGSDHDRKKKRLHTDSVSESDEEDGRKNKGGSKSKSHKHRSSSQKDKEKSSKSKSKNKGKSKRRGASPAPIPMDDVPHEETLDELDARLEREENERIAEEKMRQLESVKTREPIVAASGGVTYKG